MRTSQRAQGKLPTVGASLARGAQQQQPPQHHKYYHQQLQQQQQQVMVKKEAPEGTEETGVTWDSRQRLRQTIMDRRQAKGLDDISTASPGPVQHELTPEEIEKKERRREQNRRAAKKCRMKKKQQQTNVEGDYAQMVESNRKLEEESSNLRAQIASLQRQLDEHRQSGQCRHIKQDNATFAMATMTSSSSTSSLTSTSSTSSTFTPSPQTVEQLKVNKETYLRDFEQISPEQTFTDLDLGTFISLVSYTDDDDLDSFLSIPPQCDDNLKIKGLGSPFSASSPTSPAWHDRHSVSSVASDWSVLSDQYQGFGMVPTQNGEAGRSFLQSAGEWEADHESPQQALCQGGPVMMDFDEMYDQDDEVFPDRIHGP